MPITTTTSSSRPRCQLCQAAPAAVHCPSDDALICWSCDNNVHSANFLVSRHPRSLLCHHCSSPTPWTASGSLLPSSTFTLCEQCCCQHRQRRQPEEITEPSAGSQIIHQDNEEESDNNTNRYDDTDEDDISSDEEEEDDGENQVVPWSPEDSTAPSTTTVTSLSSSEEEDDEVLCCGLNSSKRGRDITGYKYENGEMSSAETSGETGRSPEEFRPLKRRTT